MVNKAKPPLLIAMAIGSLLGFIAIILNQLGIYDISPFITELLFVILGIGLVFEGDIKRFIRFVQGKMKFKDASAKVTTLIVGFASIAVGALSLLNINIEQLSSLKLIVSLIAVVIIILETFLLD